MAKVQVSTTQIARDLADLWRKTNLGHMSVPGHTCSNESCNIVNVNGWVTQKNGKIAVSLEKPLSKQRKRISQLFICKDTGTPHWCHSQCDARKVVSQDQGRICTISGIRYESESADTWIPQYRITATAQEHRDPHAIRSSTKYESHTTSYRTQQHLSFAKEQIFLLMFSERRLFAEQRKYLEQKHAAEKIVLKYQKGCEKTGQYAIMTNMVTLYINQIKRRRVFRGLLPKNHSTEDIVKAYAERVCVLWNIITTKTPMGKTASSLFTFKTFVASALYIMKRGMFCSKVEIIPKDYYLESVLPEANTLDHYKVNKPQFTQSKNNMTRAIREAIEEHNCDVRTLVMPPFKSPFS
mgnify:FL=1|jgi:hypothetical protein